MSLSRTITNYPMRYLPLLPYLVCTGLSLSAIPAASQNQPSSREPTYKVFVYENGMLINPKTGISVLAQSIQIRVALTDSSLDRYPYLKPSVIVKNLIASHVRNGRRIMLYPVDFLSNFLLMETPQAGDKISIVSANLRVETNEGMTRKLTRKLLLVLPVYAEK